MHGVVTQWVPLMLILSVFLESSCRYVCKKVLVLELESMSLTERIAKYKFENQGTETLSRTRASSLTMCLFLLVGCLLNMPATWYCISGEGSAQTIACAATIADQTYNPLHPLYTDTMPTSPSADPIMPGA